MNCRYPTEGRQSVGPAGSRAFQRPHCLDIVIFVTDTALHRVYMPTFIHEIVERYVFKPLICFAFVTMGSTCRKLL